MNILVVEDEQHSREELCYLLSKLVPQATLEQAENAFVAWERLETQTFNLMFLDIQMPGMNGLELAARVPRLPSPPRIVFATVNPQYALTAFELEGVDYLLKPFQEARLARTLERVRALGDSPKAKTLPPDRIWAARGEVGVLLEPSEILSCRADGNTVWVTTRAGESLPVRLSLLELEARSEAGPFVRIHKSFLVNLEHVREIEPYFSGSFRLRLSDGKCVPLSRHYAKQLRQWLGWL